MSKDKPVMKHKIEIAASGRSKCRTCKEKIEKGELRLGEEVINTFSSDNETTFQFHHLGCASKSKPVELEMALSDTTIEKIPDKEKLLSEIAKSKKTVKPTFPYGERAPTGRAKCQFCGENILKSELRIAVKKKVDTGDFVKTIPAYLHPSCTLSYTNDKTITDIITKNSITLSDADLAELISQLSVDTSVTAKEIESHFGATLPERFVAFIDTKEYQDYNGLYFADVPGWDPTAKFATMFNSKLLLNIYGDRIEITDAYNDRHDERVERYIPLMTYDQSGLLVIDSENERSPVLIWDSTTFSELYSDLDSFLKALLKKGEKTHYEKLINAYDKGDELFENGQYQQAVDLLLPLVSAYGVRMDYDRDMIGSSHNLIGICYHSLCEYDKALEYYKNASDCFCPPATQNFISLAYHHGLYDEVIEYGEKGTPVTLNQTYFYLKKPGLAYIQIGDKVNAEKKLKELMSVFLFRDINKIRETRQALQDLLPTCPYFGIVEDILSWFGENKYDLSDQAIKENREWWNSLDTYGNFWKRIMKQAIGIEKKNDGVSDQEIAHMLNIEILRINKKHNVKTLEPLRNFSKLNELKIYGDVKDLSPIKRDKDIYLLKINNKIIKNFCLPVQT